MAELSGFRLKGDIYISLTGEPIDRSWRGRVKAAWAALQGKDVQPVLMVSNNLFETVSNRPVITLGRTAERAIDSWKGR